MSTHYLQYQSSAPHDDAIWAVQWTNDNNVVSTSADGSLKIWNPSNPSTPSTTLHPHTLGITSLSIDERARWGLTCSVEGTVALTDLQRGRGVGVCESWKGRLEGEGVSAFHIALHPTSPTWVSTGQGSKIGFYTIPSSTLEALESESPSSAQEQERSSSSGQDREHEREREGYTTTPDALGRLDKIVQVGKKGFGMRLLYSPDGRSLALSTDSGQIYILDAETRAVVASHTSHAMAVRGLTWSGDSQYLFSGSDDKRIVLHDVRAGSAGSAGRGSAAVAELKGHTSWVFDLGASPDGRGLVSGGADSTLRYWDVAQRTCLSTVQTGEPVWTVDWQPVKADQRRVGKEFVWGGEGGVVNWMRGAGTGA